jgi:hypothetical protein
LTFQQVCGESHDGACGVQQGYESRHVITTVWMQTILAFMADPTDCNKCAVNAAFACRLNPLALTEVRACADGGAEWLHG